MKIFLIRHGETTSDIENRYGGDYDDSLTENGKNQAKQLAEKLTDKNIQIIFSSPLIRAKETASIINRLLNADFKIINELRERNKYGILTGMVKHEAKEKYPEEVEILKHFRNTVKDAENYEYFKNRVKEVLEKITNSGYNIIAIVTHGNQIKCIFREILQLGEFKEMGDCAFFEIQKKDKELKLLAINNASLEHEQGF